MMGDEPKLKEIFQIGFVVKDLDKAAQAYQRTLGIGPWRIYTFGPPLVKDTTYRGRREDYHCWIALAQMGGLQMELIQHLDGDNVYKEYLERSGDGVHHLGVKVDNLKRAVEEAQAAGYRVIQSGRGYGVNGDGGFAYLDTAEELGVIYELIERPSLMPPPERTWPPQQ